MSKRKATDDAEDQKNGKIQKLTDGKDTKKEDGKEKEIMSLDTESKHVIKPGSTLINFSDEATRKRFHPDTKLISRIDDTVLYYHKCLLVKIEFFDKIYNGNFADSKSGEIKFDFSARIINYFLNYIEDCGSFQVNFPKENAHYNDMIELINMADYIGHKALIAFCISQLIAGNTFNNKINNIVVQHGSDHDRWKLILDVIEGKKKIENGTSEHLISAVCSIALANNLHYQAMQDLIPYFVPDQSQIESFDLMVDTTIPATRPASGGGTPARVVKMMKGDIIEKFMEKHAGNRGADMLIRHITITLLRQNKAAAYKK